MAAIDDCDTWGEWNESENDDEEFEQLFDVQSQVTLEQEAEARLRQLHNPRRNGSGSSSSGLSMTPNLMEQAFQLRREQLNSGGREPRQPVLADGRTPEDVLSQLQYLNKEYANEKSKNYQLANQLVSAQGESSHLRREVESIKRQQQEAMYNRLQKEREERQKYEEEKKEMTKTLQSLRTELRLASNQITGLQSKLAMSPRSVGGAQSQFVKKTAFNQSSSMSAPPQKPRSDPNLNLPRPVPQKKADVSEKGVQANASAMEERKRDELLFCGGVGEEQVKIGNLEDVSSLQQAPIRRQIYERIFKLINLNFQHNAKPVIEAIVAKAPTEIMARFTRGIEMKTHFPDLVENMFLYGLQVQRRKEGLEGAQKEYPKLPSIHHPPIADLTQMYVMLESNFIHASAWHALQEIKKQLQHLLAGLKGDLRFRLYEFPNLEALWILLAWAKHLWKFILFEEELEAIMRGQEKTEWRNELKSWTGLILKIDWRDFYVPEIEEIVRGFSLSILEIIVTAGYFDSSQRRYEILYCILKDTLLKDHLRNEQFLRRSINIIIWSLAYNRNILNYLCINNNDANCLARILGEGVVKCFKELEDPYKATNLFLFFCRLLEALMVEQSPRCFSKIAIPNPKAARARRYVDISDNEEEGDNDSEGVRADPVQDVNMDVDMMCSQFACPDKYKFEDGSTERAKKFNNVKASSCWINPAEWEVPIAESKENLCQCRKVLLGSTFTMLLRVVEWWKLEFVKREGKLEKRQMLEEAALQKLKQPLEPTVTGKDEETYRGEVVKRLSSKLESLHQHLVDFSNMEEEDNEEDYEDDDKDKIVERTRAEMLSNWNPPASVVSPKDVIEEKNIPTTIYDLALQSGILLMNFCNYHAENIALAAGSDAFNCFTQIISELKVFENQPFMTHAQKRLFTEIVMSAEDEPKMPARAKRPLSDDEEDEANASCIFLPELDEVDGLFKNIPDTPLRKFDEDEFDRAFQMMEMQRKMKYQNQN